MPKFIPPCKRVDSTAFGRPFHYYCDGENKRIPGVTSVIGDGIPAPQFTAWAANATAAGAVNRWDELAAMPVADRLKVLQGIRYETSNKAKNRGTRVHALAEDIVQGRPAVFTSRDEELLLRPYCENYARFVDAWELDADLIEVTVVNYQFGYAGTLDLVAELADGKGGRKRWLLDIKTGEKGVFSDAAIQQAAYRHAEAYVDADGNEHPFNTLDPKTKTYRNEAGIEACGVIHVTADDAVLVPVEAGPDQLFTFRIAQRMAAYKKIEDEAIGAPILPPHVSTARIVWGGDND